MQSRPRVKEKNKNVGEEKAKETGKGLKKLMIMVPTSNWKWICLKSNKIHNITQADTFALYHKQFIFDLF